MNNALFTIEQVDGKLMITVELVKPETVETSYHEHLSRVKPETVETEQVDLSKYKPFPRNYKIPNNTKVIAIEDSRCFDHGWYSKGKLGEVKKNLAYEEAYVSVVFNDRPLQILMYSHELAPLDPSDHPDYKAEEVGQRPMNAEEIEDWVRRSLCTGFNPNKLTEHINALVAYELNKAKQ